MDAGSKAAAEAYCVDTARLMHLLKAQGREHGLTQGHVLMRLTALPRPMC